MRRLTLSNLLQIVVIATVAGYWTYTYFTRYDPPDNFTCVLEARPGQSSIEFGSVMGPINQISLVGLVDDPFDGRLYNFDGEARVVTSDGSRTAEARGGVFLDDNDDVQGLTIRVVDRAFARDGLQIVTLKEDGLLDYSKAEAFAYTSPPLKLAHPMDFACDVSLTPETRERRPR